MIDKLEFILALAREQHFGRAAETCGVTQPTLSAGVKQLEEQFNARLFERERADADAFEMLAEIGKEVAAVLDLDQLLSNIAQLTRRVVDYRTFGILLYDDARQELEMKVAVQYGEKVDIPKVKLGEGLVGYAALHREPVLVPDVSKDPRYINLVADVRSELVIPMLIKDRCIGVFDLESPELEAFTKEHRELMTLLASQAAVAIENARLYEEVSKTEARLEKELRFARRVQAAPVVPDRHVGRLPDVPVGLDDRVHLLEQILEQRVPEWEYGSAPAHPHPGSSHWFSWCPDS